MSSRRGGAMPSSAGPSNSESKGKGVGSSHGVDQLSRGVNTITLGSSQDGDWEVFVKPKNRGGGSAKQWGNQGSTPNAWAQPNSAQKLGTSSNSGTGKATGGAWQTQVADPKRTNGRGTANLQSRSYNNKYNAPNTAVAPPLQNAWQGWGARPAASPVATSHGSRGEDYGPDTGGLQHQSDVDDDNDDDDHHYDDDDDDDLMSDEFDSDESVKSHETRKKHSWFKTLFEVLDKLTLEEINEPSRQWHCPACRNGPGSIDWYRGLQPLITHAKTIHSKRVKIHRELAAVLDEELIRRGTSAIPAGEVFGKWAGLRETVADHEIVWPPMVIVQNTKLEMDENDEKWIGMGNQELLDYFSSYKAARAKHAYGPQGHRGLSILIFESSVVGYHEAERLHKHFTDQKTDRYAWDHQKVLFYPGGKRQLYGYMALKDDVDNFNKHSQGKAKLKFDMRSYIEMVHEPMKQMSEDNQQLIWLKNKVAKEQRHSKTLEENFSVLSKKLRKTMEENRIVRQRTKLQHEQNKEEMDFQEKFFNEQIDSIHKALEDKEAAFEEMLQAERKKVKQATVDSRTQEEGKLRQEKMAEFIQSQVQGIEEFEAKREQLIKMHDDKKAEMKRKYMEDEIELEKEFESSLTKLMEQYAPPQSSEEVSTAPPLEQ